MIIRSGPARRRRTGGRPVGPGLRGLRAVLAVLARDGALAVPGHRPARRRRAAPASCRRGERLAAVLGAPDPVRAGVDLELEVLVRHRGQAGLVAGVDQRQREGVVLTRRQAPVTLHLGPEPGRLAVRGPDDASADAVGFAVGVAEGLAAVELEGLALADVPAVGDVRSRWPRDRRSRPTAWAGLTSRPQRSDARWPTAWGWSPPPGWAVAARSRPLPWSGWPRRKPRRWRAAGRQPGACPAGPSTCGPVPGPSGGARHSCRKG